MLTQVFEDLCLCFFKIFIILSLKLKSVIHFELSVIHEVRQGSNHMALYVAILLSQNWSFSFKG